MANRITRVIKTLLIRIFHYNTIQIEGFPDLSFDTKFHISSNGKIRIGKGVLTFSNVHLSVVGGNLEIGESTSFNRNGIVVCQESIKIGGHCQFGPNVCIYDHDHIYDSQGVKNEFKTSPIIIGDNCWIGANTVVLRGTRIGEGSVIGAGVVVKGEIPAHSLVTGERTMVIKQIK